MTDDARQREEQSSAEQGAAEAAEDSGEARDDRSSGRAGEAPRASNPVAARSHQRSGGFTVRSAEASSETGGNGPAPPPGTSPAIPPPPPPAPAGAPPSSPAGTLPTRRGWLILLLAALIGAMVGGGVAAGVIMASDDATVQVVERRPNSSIINVADDIQSILAEIEPAVVAVRTRTLDLNVFLEPIPSEGAGTGFVIGSDGVIVTNDHVVRDAQRIEVILPGGEAEQAVILGRDPEFDMAVLKIDRTGLPTATLGDSDLLQVGDDVIAIGNALALGGGPTVTRGIVSATERALAGPGGIQLESMIQTDAAINPGNSGGPLVNAAGEVVGINTAIIQGAQNIGFAIAINAVKPVISDLREGRVITRPFLGVQTISVDADVARQFGLDVEVGALVLEVVPGSGAELAGLQRGDVIVEIAGTEIEDSRAVGAVVREHEPDDEVSIVFLRGDDRRTVTATLGERTTSG